MGEWVDAPFRNATLYVSFAVSCWKRDKKKKQIEAFGRLPHPPEWHSGNSGATPGIDGGIHL
jgi:hypothetical protein